MLQLSQRVEAVRQYLKMRRQVKHYLNFKSAFGHVPWQRSSQDRLEAQLVVTETLEGLWEICQENSAALAIASVLRFNVDGQNHFLPPSYYASSSDYWRARRAAEYFDYKADSH
jgi:hypothetical protein